MKDKYIRLLKKINMAYGRFSVKRRKVWFVDIPRTSSSSIRSELGMHYGRAYGKRNVIEKEYAISQIFLDHMTASTAKNTLGHSLWDEIFTFTIVRNPWDRVLSLYYYRQKVSEIPKEWSFRDYVIKLGEATSESEYFKYHGCRFGAAEFILGEDGEVLVDFIAKYENRDHDLKLIASRFNLSFLGELEIQKATPTSVHYSTAYDLETKEIVRRLYAKDIEMFDYEFESEA